MIKVKDVTRPVTKVTASVTEKPKRNAKSNAERQRLFRQRKRMRRLTDEQFLAETVNADG